MRKFQVISFGEVLWDVFPDKNIIGGAPLNVAFRLHSFGVEVALISRIGKDDSGQGIQNYFVKHQLPVDLIQLDDTFPTGRVNIALSNQGIPSYSILSDVAWDYIAITPENISAVKDAPIFLFGSLAIRNRNNLQSLYELLNQANTKIFDVNFRSPFYDLQTVFDLIKEADVLKLNHEEIIEICDGLKCDALDLKGKILWLCKRTKTETICVTLGDEGALLYYDGEFYSHTGFQVQVFDTVGAGDSFLATLIHELFIEKRPPEHSLSKACAIGAFVASSQGANVKIESSSLKRFGH